MADQRIPDVNLDRNSSRTSTEDAKRRAEETDQSSSSARHGGAGKMGMDRPTADPSRSSEANDGERAHWPDEDGNLEQSSGHP